MKKREPKFLGSGIYMTLQPWTQHPIPGDTVFDADLGELKWDGKEWQSVKYIHTTKPKAK